MYKNFLFDLDGTLLPMDIKRFIELYISSFCQKFVPLLGVDAKTLNDGIWKGAAAMAKNDGECLNSELFWRAMNNACGRDMRKYSDDFDEYYRNEFAAAKKSTKANPYAKRCVELIKSTGAKMVVATNPIFPKACTYQRVAWAGLDVNDFEYITVYDNCSRCKPNLNYFDDICSICGISPEESIMVGNDVDEDMCASRLGFDTYLITDCMINRHDKDISIYKQGRFEDFYDFLLINQS